MLSLLLFFLTAALVNCVPLGEDSKDILYDEDSITDWMNSSSISFQVESENEIGDGFDEIARTSSTNPDSDIIRRQVCKEKLSNSVDEPEKPAPDVSLVPKFLNNLKIKPKYDPECVNFGARPSYVTCGGPEV